MKVDCEIKEPVNGNPTHFQCDLHRNKWVKILIYIISKEQFLKQ